MPEIVPAEFVDPADLDAILETALVGNPKPQGRPLLGVEVERLILHEATRESASIEFCRRLLDDLATDIDGRRSYEGEVLSRVDGDGFSFTMEPGGQLELAAAPKANLSEIDSMMKRIRSLVDRRLEGTGYATVSLGHAPVTKVADLGLLPRRRYELMDQSMVSRGHLTCNMMRATAGFQVTYDVNDRADAGRKLALLNRLVPIMVALTANSRIVEGRDSGFESYRHYVWLHTDRDRVGVPEGGLHAETAVDGYKTFARRATMIFQRRNGELIPSPEQRFEDVVGAGQVTSEDLDLHLTSLFPFVRLRDYLEVRFLDAAPWPLARAVVALLSGLIYGPTALAQAEALSESLVPADDAAFLDLQVAAARHGLDARDANGTSFRDLARELLAFAEATLRGDDSQWAEPGDLEAVAARLA